MARPAAKDLTDRELEVMHVFWRHGELTDAGGGPTQRVRSNLYWFSEHNRIQMVNKYILQLESRGNVRM